mmetsp:Transcript_107906/g.270636  ORF Transcript_107906/g.270636 Transcript_107906/m.270636 type:complete len:385 (-) Transcript_107906:54-1208(-)
MDASLRWPTSWTMPRSFWACHGFCCRDGFESELAFGKAFGFHATTLQRNLAAANSITQEFLAESKHRCLEEKQQYERQGTQAHQQKRNRWATYTNPDRAQQCLTSSLTFIREYPECRISLLPTAYLRSLILLQHSLAEDTLDVSRPDNERRHCDTFEGILTKGGVNSQLIKDAHRSEWSIEGHSFSLQGNPQQLVGGVPITDGSGPPMEDRKAVIAAFQQDLVRELEQFLLDFCRRRRLTEQGTLRMMQAVTTQMSQCGLANLEQSSQASKVFVSGEGLEQRTAYNISTMLDPRGEVLKLSIYCMKTGFSSYHTPESLMGPTDPDDDETCLRPVYCSTASYLYQYATICFAPSPAGGPEGREERIECVVIDLLDEVQILPVEPL